LVSPSLKVPSVPSFDARQSDMYTAGPTCAHLGRQPRPRPPVHADRVQRDDLPRWPNWSASTQLTPATRLTSLAVKRPIWQRLTLQTQNDFGRLRANVNTYSTAQWRWVYYIHGCRCRCLV